MSQVEALEQTIRTLPTEQVRELQEWLQDYLEDLEEMSPEFVARLDRAQQQLDGGKGRVVSP
jgi:predicted transcriptional regulator